MSKLLLQAGVLAVTVGLTLPALATDPSGSAPALDRAGVGRAPQPQVLSLPGRGPTGPALRIVPPALGPAGPGQPATGDEQVDALLQVVLTGPGGGFGLVAQDGGGTAASAANCWADGTGCGGGQATFIANCDAAGGGLSSENDPEHGPYIRCTLPPK
ncbi:MAG: hypothetical protein R3F55_10855 [Alphaproteobacteria bacterium]